MLMAKKFLEEQEDGTGICPDCNMVIYPDEMGCGCGRTWKME